GREQSQTRPYRAAGELEPAGHALPEIEAEADQPFSVPLGHAREMDSRVGQSAGIAQDYFPAWLKRLVCRAVVVLELYVPREETRSGIPRGGETRW
ncbi:MAG: hypothetical protein ACRDS9_25270, partial [Pseudonocardiaceae bacterium]